MRLDDPEWVLAKLAAKQLSCTPEQFVTFATVHLAQMLLAGTEKERRVMTSTIRAVMNEPDIFAHLRSDSHAIEELRKKPRSTRPHRGRSDRVFVADEPKPKHRPPGLTHNPFASLLKPED